MGKTIKYTTQSFIIKSEIIHHSKYDYSLVNYINNRTKVKIICPIHGAFDQIPKTHLEGSGCKICGGKSTLTKDLFIEKSNIIHHSKYDYSLVNYINNRTKVKIICHIHGIFEQLPFSHLSGKNCKLCKFLSKNDFIKNSIKIHGDKYDYSLVRYVNNKSKVKIICPTHGAFEQTPNLHMRGTSCKKCINNNIKKDNSDFIESSKKIHGDKYDYSLVKYKNNKSKVKIICLKHGIFEQSASSHYTMGCGCPECKMSKGELSITTILNKYNITYKYGFRLENYEYDFYLPNYQIMIEFDGIQHYKPIDFFGGIEKFKEQQKRDNIKNKICISSKIKLLRIPYYEIDNIENIIKECLDNYPNIPLL